MQTLTVNLDSPAKPDSKYIRDMFDKLARRYDAFTFLTGFGQAGRWRNECVVGLDFSQRMLDMAQRRYEKQGVPGHLNLVCKKAEELPIDEKPFDLVVSGFVLRNLYENIDPILSGVYRTLKTGGQISFLDLTEPRHPFLAKLFRFYMLTFVGFYGWILFGRDYPIPYLPDSAKRFLKAYECAGLIQKAGFRNVRARPLMFGIVTLYEAVK